MVSKPKVVDQELVDVIFAIASRSATWGRGFDHETYDTKDREEHMKWVADQLRYFGIDTIPVGMSWGVLKDDGSTGSRK